MLFSKLAQPNRRAMIGCVILLCLLIQSCGTSESIKSDNSTYKPKPSVSQLRANILPTHYFSYRTDDEISKVQFLVPEEGEAILNIQTGIMLPYIGAIPKIIINDKPIAVKLPTLKRAAEMPIMLHKGNNSVTVDFNGADAIKGIVLRIDAVPDTLNLVPLPNPILLGQKSFKAKASLTALGVPVSDATVSFKVKGLGKNISASAKTGYNGIATAHLAGIGAGAGELRVHVPTTSLSTSAKIQVTDKPFVKIEPVTSNFIISVGSTVVPKFTLTNLRKENEDAKVAITYTAKFEGLSASFPNSVIIQPGKTTTLQGTLKGLKAGKYDLYITATNTKTGHSEVAEIHATVREPFELSAPTSIPSRLALNAEPTKVIFRTLVADTPKPTKLLLDEVDSQGRVVADRRGIAELRDDGKDTDSVEGDGFYSGVHTVDIAGDIEKGISQKGESVKFYRIRAILNSRGKAITSDQLNFPITALPLISRPSDSAKLISDKRSVDRFYSNEVIITSLPRVTTTRISEIVGAISEDITIVGYIPSLQSYLLEISSSNGSSDVRKAVSLLKSYPEIKSASLNFEVTPTAAEYTPNDPRYPTNCAATNNAEADQCQYYLQTIRADKAWNWLKERNPNFFNETAVKVGVIDTGIDFDHQDLGTTKDSTVLLQNNSGNKNHGTIVAGLIAAQHNDVGIAGVAPNTKLIPYSSSNTWGVITAFVDQVKEEVKIFNFSLQVPNDDSGDIKRAICAAICERRLIVAAAGNVPSNVMECPATELYPGRYNDLIQEQDGCVEPVNVKCDCGMTIPQSMLTVGATDLDIDDDNIIDSMDNDIVDAQGNHTVNNVVIVYI